MARLAPWGLLALCPSSALAAPVAPGNTFGVLGNWGGTDTAPYSTPGQVAAAAGLEAVAAATNMLFLVSTGGNFLPTGLPRACPPPWLLLLTPPAHDTNTRLGSTPAVHCLGL